MKRNLIIALALCCIMAVSCDFVRRIAGRPTSADIEQIRQERALEQERLHQARLDSMKQVRQQMEDSLAALEAYLLDSLVQSKGAAHDPSSLGGVQGEKPKGKYCVVVGAFRNRDNATRKQKACEEAGYEVTLVYFRNGLTAVTLCPSDSLPETVERLHALRAKGICPPDGWILLND